MDCWLSIELNWHACIIVDDMEIVNVVKEVLLVSLESRVTYAIFNSTVAKESH